MTDLAINTHTTSQAQGNPNLSMTSNPKEEATQGFNFITNFSYT